MPSCSKAALLVEVQTAADVGNKNVFVKETKQDSDTCDSACLTTSREQVPSQLFLTHSVLVSASGANLFHQATIIVWCYKVWSPASS